MADNTPEKSWPVRAADMLDELTQAGAITWGSDGDRRKHQVVALGQLSLANLEDGSQPSLVIKKGGTAWPDEEKDLQKPAFMVSKGGYGG
jgi:hypothetical protein